MIHHLEERLPVVQHQVERLQDNHHLLPLPDRQSLQLQLGLRRVLVRQHRHLVLASHRRRLRRQDLQVQVAHLRRHLVLQEQLLEAALEAVLEVALEVALEAVLVRQHRPRGRLQRNKSQQQNLTSHRRRLRRRDLQVQAAHLRRRPAQVNLRAVTPAVAPALAVDLLLQAAHLRVLDQHQDLARDHRHRDLASHQNQAHLLRHLLRHLDQAQLRVVLKVAVATPQAVLVAVHLLLQAAHLQLLGQHQDLALHRRRHRNQDLLVQAHLLALAAAPAAPQAVAPAAEVVVDLLVQPHLRNLSQHQDLARDQDQDLARRHQAQGQPQDLDHLHRNQVLHHRTQGHLQLTQGLAHLHQTQGNRHQRRLGHRHHLVLQPQAVDLQVKAHLRLHQNLPLLQVAAQEVEAAANLQVQLHPHPQAVVAAAVDLQVKAHLQHQLAQIHLQLHPDHPQAVVAAAVHLHQQAHRQHHLVLIRHPPAAMVVEQEVVVVVDLQIQLHPHLPAVVDLLIQNHRHHRAHPHPQAVMVAANLRVQVPLHRQHHLVQTLLNQDLGHLQLTQGLRQGQTRLHHTQTHRHQRLLGQTHLRAAMVDLLLLVQRLHHPLRSYLKHS